ncbi:unnamed protein product [Adineta ricciae]|uniref:Uncharacterized protein n=1 Tax=Adineta ricciae TaxID=249248 RepID=A0A815VNY8_ADIRI|nr:unnamed protein product [Adineta ricciae]CAF1535365.1 unnamed protein product [Adineta ricciae]
MKHSLVIFLFFVDIQAGIFLFDTQDSRLVEQYDCIYHTTDVSIKYCRRPGTNITLDRSKNDCFNGGERLSFQSLLEQHISPQDILQWNSSLERVDDYASFFYNTHQTNLKGGEYFCRCIQPGTFGKSCEYHFLDGATSFAQAIKEQFEEKQRNPWGAQHYGAILCYRAQNCYSGLLCLDWRNICDGEQQCHGGYDEEHCDLLEFNECEMDEYRCSNGMCIPDAYWLDGEIDCMDRSDEKSDLFNSDCFYQTDYFRCDESVCSAHLWSCGDGQCINSWNRFGYQRLILSGGECLSHRELNHMCEASRRYSLWTKSDTGLCTNQLGYDDPNLSISQTSSVEHLCFYLIRCALSSGLERDCVCNQLNCSQLIITECGRNLFYAFPAAQVVRPYMIAWYSTDHNWLDPTPDDYSFEGEILCRGYYAKISISDSKGLSVSVVWIQHAYVQLDFEFCRKATIKDVTGPQFDPFCWSNHSLTFNNKASYAFHPSFCKSSHRCVTYYRARDRVYDCHDMSDEESDVSTEHFCQNIRKHRFSCSKQEPYCISISYFPYSIGICSDSSDRYVIGSDRLLQDLKCFYRGDPDCSFLRDYIYNSSIRNISRDLPTTSSISRSPLHWYCDSFWDTSSHSDELPEYCKSWICPRDQYQCQTGQCIPLFWLCDGEWDCSDASDEEVLLSIDKFSEHNQKLTNFSNHISLCYQRYTYQAFSNICNGSSELPCFRANVSNPLNITEFRPCISFKQIGDKHEDCVAGHDEKNTIADCNGFMLGFTYRGDNGTCYNHNRYICSDVFDDSNKRLWCFYQQQNSSSCSKERDVICLDGSCKPNARCNGTFECAYGEDEYRCVAAALESDYIIYRREKEHFKRNIIPQLYWNIHPSTMDFSHSTPRRERRMSSEEENAFICNRGVAIGLSEKEKVCFCSPGYYGNYCEFYSDRLTVITHLNITETMQHSIFKVIAILRTKDVVLSHHEFIVNGTFEKDNPIKHRFTLLYSRLSQFLNYTRVRYLYRPEIVHVRYYSVHFNLFLLNVNETIELGQWIYPIYFDFLPSFRLAKILTVSDEYLNQTDHSCDNHTCPSDSDCLPIFNQPGQFYCSCQNGVFNNKCQPVKNLCSSYCSSKSICKPGYRGFFSNVDRPFCVCSLGYYGPRCHLRHEECHFHPCLNNGTCHLTYDPTGENPFRCQCQTEFYGYRCEKRKSFIQIDLNMTDPITPVVSIVQFCDIRGISLEIVLQDQQLINGLPSTISYNHPEMKVPILGILKTYIDIIHLNYFIIYLIPNVTQMQIRSTPKRCPEIMTLMDQMPLFDDDDVPIVFKYHYICRHFQDLYCFYSNDYLCVCELDNHRASCFLHDMNIDQCQLCFSNGKCLRGNLKESKDFYCICSKCRQGDRCQFSLEAFGSTIDSLLSSYSSTIQFIYLIISGCLLLIGLINNILSFITIRRSIPQQTAVGHFLLIITLLNKLSLFSLCLKFLDNSMESFGWLISDQLNLIFCKTFSYLLSISTRSFYWLASWITIDRLLMVVFPTKILFRRPFLAKLISSLTLLIICLMHSHEILFYTIIEQSSSTVCVTHFEDMNIAYYNRVTTLIHYLVPFAVQIICITFMIVYITRIRTKAKDTSNFSRSALIEQFISLKELYVTPLAIVISALPQITVSFTLACQELVSWQKHLLLSTYLLSYIPQVLAFFLFILSSSLYRKEFFQTYIGQKLFS